MSPAEQVFCNQEVVDAILRLLSETLQQTSPTPGKWKRHLVPLLVVSKTFFHASIDQLWESMGSFLPFVRLLPSVEEVPPPSILTETMLGDIWSRFSIYSPRTRELSIKSDTKPFSAWFTMITSQANSLDTLFPRLRRLNIHSTNALSSIFLSRFAAQLEHCNIGSLGDDSEASNFTTTSLVEISMKAKNLEELNVIAPVHASAAAYIPEVRGLRRLVLRISQPMEPDQLLFLKRIPALRALYFENGGVGRARSFSTEEAQTIEDITTSALKRQAEFPMLSWFRVRGDGDSQFDAARIISPTNLQALRLDVSLTGSDSVLLPNALRIYLERSKDTIQTITVTSDKRVRELALRRFPLLTTDPAIHRIPEFLSALSNATQLCEITIEQIPFRDNDMISKIINIVPNLPHLVRLTVRPTTLSTSVRDAIVYPPLGSLGAISKQCPSLKYFNAPIDLANTPPLPQRSPHPPQLSTLCIGTGKQSDTQMPLSQLIAVGQYIAAVFPNLMVLEPVNDDDPADVAFWKQLEGLVRSYYDTRARAIQETSMIPRE